MRSNAAPTCQGRWTDTGQSQVEAGRRALRELDYLLQEPDIDPGFKETGETLTDLAKRETFFRDLPAIALPRPPSTARTGAATARLWHASPSPFAQRPIYGAALEDAGQHTGLGTAWH